MTVSESTVDYDVVHPAKSFLETCGLQTESFPKFRLVLETPRGLFKNSQSFTPLRLPEKPGFVYESLARIMRVIEMPTATHKHRKFLEIEWTVDENPLLEEETHPAFSFVSSEVQCPSCKSIFLPEVNVVDPFAIRVSCPSCFHYWTIRVEAPQLDRPNPRLLSDVYFRDPTRLRRLLQWTDRAHQDTEFFPAHFKPTDDLSLEWLFEGSQIFCESRGQFQSDFDILWKSFLNTRFIHSFSSAKSSVSSKLDSTEIFRKTEVSGRITAPLLRVSQLETKENKDGLSHSLEAEFPIEITSVSSVSAEQSTLKRAQLDFRQASPQKPIDRSLGANSSERSLAGVWAGVLGGALALAMSTVAFLYFFPTEHKQKFVSASASIPVSQTAQSKGVKPPPASVQIPSPSEKVAKTTEAPMIAEALAQPKRDEAELARKAQKDLEREKELKRAEQERLEFLAKQKAEVEAQQKRKKISEGLERGSQLMEEQKFLEASREFEKVIEIDPKNTRAIQSLGVSYIYVKRFNEAIAIFENLLSVSKDEKERVYIQEMLATLKDQQIPE